MVELLFLVLFLVAVVGVSFVGPVRDRIWVHRSLRDDCLEQMSKVNPESTLHTELAVKALRHDAIADNAWRQDFDDVVQAIKNRKSTALVMQRATETPPVDLAAQLDKARVTVMNDTYQRVERLVKEVQAIEATPETRDALEGIIHNYEKTKHRFDAEANNFNYHLY